MSESDVPVMLHPENRRYFLYAGRPVVLITATEHYGAVINRNMDYVRYLDEMVDKQLTLSRCFLLFRELEHQPQNPHSPCKPLPGEYVAPFLRTGPGFTTDGYPRFDLDQWDAEYFERLHGFLAEASARGVIVELTLFSNTYAEHIWALNPLNIRNNVNGIGAIAWQDYNSMRDPALFDRQKDYVRKIVREANRYDNFYFEVCNEPGCFAQAPGHASADEIMAWQAAIRQVIRSEEATLSKKHLVVQVPVGKGRGETALESLADEPTIDGINFHDYHRLTYRSVPIPPMGRWVERDLNLNPINYLFTLCQDADKPLIFDEDNAASGYQDIEAWTVHRKRAWATVCSGGHYDMIDFSIQPGGQEGSTPAARTYLRSWMKHLSSFIHGTDFVHASPVRGFCQRLPEHTFAAALAKPAAEYVIYVADEREVGEVGVGDPCEGVIAFNLPLGSYRVKLFDPVSGRYEGAEQRIAGGDVSLALGPFTHDIVVHITAA
ncbi:MAG: cellulase family glycosylhydrolase [Anaerolineales bacterium]|nr:cellulase family glycosylhydrolase [Anaerolineales bacterium]